MGIITAVRVYLISRESVRTDCNVLGAVIVTAEYSYLIVGRYVGTYRSINTPLQVTMCRLRLM